MSKRENFFCDVISKMNHYANLFVKDDGSCLRFVRIGNNVPKRVGEPDAGGVHLHAASEEHPRLVEVRLSASAGSASIVYMDTGDNMICNAGEGGGGDGCW